MSKDVNGGATDAVVDLPLDWTGPDDPDNPRNFTLLRRVSSTFAVTFLAFVSTFGASVYSPGIQDIQLEFNISEELAILPLSLYTVGLALGPLIGSPLCETLGRKIVYLVTSPLFALFTLGAGFSTNITALSICRLFAGVFAAPAIGNASATIIDYTAGRYRTVLMSFYYSIPIIGAVTGPLVGGFVVQSKGWRWTQWTTIFFIIAFYIPILFTRESYQKIILLRRARKLGHATLPSPTPIAFLRHFLTTQLLRPVHMLCTEPIVTLVCTYNGFLFGLIYLFIVASPYIYATIYSFDLTGQSLSFLGLSIGALLAPIPLIITDHYIYQPRLKRFNNATTTTQQNSPTTTTTTRRFPSENRLYAALPTSLLQPLFLLAFAWTAQPHIPWIIPLLFQAASMTTSVIIYASVSIFMMDEYGPLYGASAAGATMLSRYGLSAAFPLFALQLYRALGVAWATSLLGFCTLAMAPVPWLFWRWGRGLRERGRYETSGNSWLPNKTGRLRGSPPPPIPGTFVVSFGNPFEAATSRTVKATTHRVVTGSETRFSVPFFQGVPADLTVSGIRALMPESVGGEDEEEEGGWGSGG